VCRGRPSVKKVHTVSERDSDESTDEEYTYRITLHSVHDEAQPLTEMTIGGKTVKCLIDPGAGVNVIDTCTFNQLGNITFHLPQRGSMLFFFPLFLSAFLKNKIDTLQQIALKNK